MGLRSSSEPVTSCVATSGCQAIDLQRIYSEEEEEEGERDKESDSTYVVLSKSSSFLHTIDDFTASKLQTLIPLTREFESET